MKMFVLFILLNLTSFQSFTQDISGNWEADNTNGVYLGVSVNQGPANVSLFTRDFRITINDGRNSFEGQSKLSHSFIISTADISGNIIADSQKIFFSVKKIEHNGIIRKSPPGIQNQEYHWVYFTDDTNEYLLCQSVRRHTRFPHLPDYIRFKRPAKPENKIYYTGIDSASSPVPHPVLSRKDEVFETIKTDAKTVKLQLYDNAEIDGDSVSVFLNNTLIAANIALKSTPYEMDLHLDPLLPVNKLVVFADNLGSIPPNTAFITVTIKGKTHRLIIKSDQVTNGSIVFKVTH